MNKEPLTIGSLSMHISLSLGEGTIFFLRTSLMF